MASSPIPTECISSRGLTAELALGINGLITNHFAALAVVGWKSLFFDRNESFDSVVGNAELTWYPLPRPDLAPGAATVGLLRSASGTGATQRILSRQLCADRRGLRQDILLSSRGMFLVSLEAGVDHTAAPARATSRSGAVQSAPFSENRVNATGFAEYRSSDTFGINTTLRYSGERDQSGHSVTERPTADGYDDLSFNRFEAWVGVR
jgi:hypothetical protein